MHLNIFVITHFNDVVAVK